MLDDRMIPLKVDGTSYQLTVQDFGTHWKLRVYRNDRMIGFKDHPIRVSINEAVMSYTVRQIVKGQDGKTTSI